MTCEILMVVPMHVFVLVLRVLAKNYQILTDINSPGHRVSRENQVR